MLLTIKWFILHRWQFEKSAKVFGKKFPGSAGEVYSAAIRNNLAGCRDNKTIAKDMLRILLKYN